MKNNDFIYGFRIIDLKRKYFGDILSEEVICKKREAETEQEDDEVVKEILERYK